MMAGFSPRFRWIVALLIALVGSWQSLPASGQTAPSCDVYLFQEDAQLALDGSPLWEGSAALDPDGDGIACPELTRFTEAGVRLLVEPGATTERATVVRITDGDTLRITLDATGQEWPVRMIVTNAPERNDCYGSQATKALGRVLKPGATVWLQRIDRNVDGNDRLLRHVWYAAGDGTWRLAEHELARRGYVFARDYGDGSAYMPYVAEAMRAAELGDFGLWSACPGVQDVKSYADVTALAEGRASALALDGSVGVVISAPDPEPQLQVEPTAPPPIDIGGGCEPSYPSICIPLGSADLDCGDLSARRFQVLPPDPHRFDGDGDGVGCESG